MRFELIHMYWWDITSHVDTVCHSGATGVKSWRESWAQNFTLPVSKNRRKWTTPIQTKLAFCLLGPPPAPLAWHDVCPHGERCSCRWLMDLMIGALSALWGYLSPSNWLRKSTKTGNPGKSRTRLLLYRVLIGRFVFPGNYTLTGGAHHSLHQDQDHAPGILQLSTSAVQTSSSLVYT